MSKLTVYSCFWVLFLFHSGKGYVLLGQGTLSGISSERTIQKSGWSIDNENSFVAVVTQKDGIASGFAHNHLILARTIHLERLVIPLHLKDLRATVRVPVNDLVVDDPAAQKRWSAWLTKVGILSDRVELGDLSEGQRKDVFEKMVSSSQLDASKFPDMFFELKSVDLEGNQPKTLRVDAQIRGVRSSLGFVVKEYIDSSESLELSGTASSKFSDFGIEPVSMFLGAVRNKDEIFFAFKVVILKPRVK